MTDWYLSQFDGRFVVLGTLLCLAGLAVVYRGWRQPSRRLAWLLPGWGVIALGYGCWILGSGFDAGPALATTLVMLSALVLVLVNGQWRRKDRQAKRRRPASVNGESAVLTSTSPGLKTPSLQLVCTTTLNAVIAGPLALLFSLSLAVLVIPLAPWAEATRIMVAAMIALVAWSIAMVWICATRRPGRVAAAMFAATLSSFVLLQLTR